MPAKRLLLTILIGGLIAGFGAALFHTVATEPIIDQAIMLEEMRHADEPESEPIVSRDVQKKGLFVGWAVLGLTWATLLGGIYGLGRTRGWFSSDRRVPMLLALAAFCAFALVPGVKYPANPPGVGSAATIDMRQQLFIASWVLSFVGLVVAALVARRVTPTSGARLAVGIPLYAVWSIALVLLLPANPDPITMPVDLVMEFRARSLIGLALFWALLGAAFAWSTRRQTATSPRFAPQPLS
jgi:predicted cobalt transporter CbtA